MPIPPAWTKALLNDVPPRERVRSSSPTWIASTTPSSTAGSWRSPARSSASRATASRAGDADTLWDAAERIFAQPDWEAQVLRRSNIEKVFLTNDFDDPLTGFDTTRYVPCLRTDDLVFHLDNRQCGSGWRGRPTVRWAI